MTTFVSKLLCAVRIAVVSLALGHATRVQGQVISTFMFSGINADIPDADLSGLVDTQSLTLSESVIQNVSVVLSISGTSGSAFNGDYTVYLQHDSGFAVL